MNEYIDKNEAVGEGYLQDWYIASVSEDDEPVWTEAHIEELANDFIVIPNDTPAADVAPVVHGRWIKTGLRIMTSSGASGSVCVCSICKGQPEIGCTPPYCPNCGAKMDGGRTNGEDN